MVLDTKQETKPRASARPSRAVSLRSNAVFCFLPLVPFGRVATSRNRKLKFAESMGFEPMRGFNAPTSLAVRRFRPLSQLSNIRFCENAQMLLSVRPCFLLRSVRQSFAMPHDDRSAHFVRGPDEKQIDFAFHPLSQLSSI